MLFCVGWCPSLRINNSLFTQYLMCIYVCAHLSAHVCVCMCSCVTARGHPRMPFFQHLCFLRQSLTGTPGLPIRPGRLAMEPQGSFVSASSMLPAHQLFNRGLRELNSGPHTSTSMLPTDHLPALFICSESLSVPPAH